MPGNNQACTIENFWNTSVPVHSETSFTSSCTESAQTKKETRFYQATASSCLNQTTDFRRLTLQRKKKINKRHERFVFNMWKSNEFLFYLIKKYVEKSVAFKLKNTESIVKHGGGSIMLLCWCRVQGMLIKDYLQTFNFISNQRTRNLDTYWCVQHTKQNLILWDVYF